MGNNLQLLSVADDNLRSENNIKKENCTVATSSAGGKAEGAVTDKMEGAFFSWPSKGKDRQSKTPLTISAQTDGHVFDLSRPNSGIQCFRWGIRCQSVTANLTDYHIKEDLMRSECLCDARFGRNGKQHGRSLAPFRFPSCENQVPSEEVNTRHELKTQFVWKPCFMTWASVSFFLWSKWNLHVLSLIKITVGILQRKNKAMWLKSIEYKSLLGFILGNAL